LRNLTPQKNFSCWKCPEPAHQRWDLFGRTAPLSAPAPSLPCQWARSITSSASSSQWQIWL